MALQAVKQTRDIHMRDYWLTQYLFAIVGWGYLFIVVAALGVALWLPKTKRAKGVMACIVIGLASVPLIKGYESYQRDELAAKEYKERYEKANALFAERCKTAGEKIYKTVDNVEGVLLAKVREESINFSEQYRMNDPYGQLNARGLSYLEQYLWGREDSQWLSDKHVLGGYRYVDLADANGGIRRYSMQLSQPEGTLKNRSAIVPKASNYVVEWADISSKEDRDNWVACGSLSVRDSKNGDLLGERKGCIFDKGLGNTDGGRAPWAFALNTSCPANRTTPDGRTYHEPVDRNFVEKILKPIKGE